MFPDRLQSPFTDSQTRSVPNLGNALVMSDRPSLQYDVPALKALALNYIRGELAKCDIVEEAFSRFASQ